MIPNSNPPASASASERLPRLADREHDQGHSPGPDGHVEGIGAGRDPKRGRAQHEEGEGAAGGGLAGDRAGGKRQRHRGGGGERDDQRRRRARPAEPGAIEPEDDQRHPRRVTADVGRVGVDAVGERGQELARRVHERDHGQVLVVVVQRRCDRAAARGQRERQRPDRGG